MRTKSKITTLVGNKTGLKMTTFVGTMAITGALALAPAKADITGFGPDDLTRTGGNGGASISGSEWTATPTQCCGGNSVVINAEAATLTLGGGGGYNGGSAFDQTQQSVASGWSSSFTFNENAGGNQSTWAFVLQNDSRGAAAVDKLKNDYAGKGSPLNPALEVVFKKTGTTALNAGFINNAAGGTVSGFQATTASTGITDFTAAPITANLSYSGTTLTLNLTQGALTYTATDTIDLPTLLGSSTAFVGFDANRMDQGVTISNFSYTTSSSPSVPEPSEFGYLALGLASLAAVMRLRRNRLA